MFSVIRSKGGHNDNPTVTQARAALRTITCNNLIRTPSTGTNCERTDIEFLLPSIPKCLNSDTTDCNEEPLITEAMEFDNVDIDKDQDVSAYVTGHAIFRLVKCKECNLQLCENIANDKFIQFKTYSDNCKLKQPREEVVSDVIAMKNYVFGILSRVAHHTNVSEIISHNQCVDSLFCYSFISESCRLHLQTILKQFFIKFFIKVYCKRKQETISSMTQQKKKKYKKLFL